MARNSLERSIRDLAEASGMSEREVRALLAERTGAPATRKTHSRHPDFEQAHEPDRPKVNPLIRPPAPDMSAILPPRRG